MLTIRGILHPTDFSELSEPAFRFACALAKDYHAPVYVLHVSSPSDAVKGEQMSATHSEQYLHKQWRTLEEMEAAVPGVEIRRCLEEGNTAEQILHCVDSLPCDFIVMGTHARTGLARLFMGSVAEDVIRHAPCPVIVVKPTFQMAEPLTTKALRKSSSRPNGRRKVTRKR